MVGKHKLRDAVGEWALPSNVRMGSGVNPNGGTRVAPVKEKSMSSKVIPESPNVE